MLERIKKNLFNLIKLPPKFSTLDLNEKTKLKLVGIKLDQSDHIAIEKIKSDVEGSLFEDKGDKESGLKRWEKREDFPEFLIEIEKHLEMYINSRLEVLGVKRKLSYNNAFLIDGSTNEMYKINGTLGHYYIGSDNIGIIDGLPSEGEKPFFAYLLKLFTILKHEMIHAACEREIEIKADIHDHTFFAYPTGRAKIGLGEIGDEWRGLDEAVVQYETYLQLDEIISTFLYKKFGKVGLSLIDYKALTNETEAYLELSECLDGIITKISKLEENTKESYYNQLSKFMYKNDSESAVRLLRDWSKKLLKVGINVKKEIDFLR